ncbi:MAG: LysR family transcriptional regulator [Xanthomonadaceae bacterium]|nr:LysR family transcriptional regulator [Xanthomonadaceae bacterium]
MHLTLRQLQIFAAIADTGSTTAAGRHISLSQSAVSGALNELEELLGARLFDRPGKRLLLNDSGRALLPQARNLLDLAQRIEWQFGIGDAETDSARIGVRIRLGASTTIGNYLVPDLIAAYLKTQPDTRFDVQIGNSREISTAVARLDVDVGLIEGPCHEPDLRVVPWRTDELAIVCAANHPLARADLSTRRSLRTLRQSRWLLREPGSGTREAVEHALLPHLDHFDSTLQFGSTEAIKQAAAAGLGLTCLSLSAIRDLVTLRRLVVLKTVLPRLTRRFYFVHHPAKPLSAGLAHFIVHCESVVDDDITGAPRGRHPSHRAEA